MKLGLLWLCALGTAAVPSAVACAQAPSEPKWSTPADRPSAASDLAVCREVRMSRKSGVYTFTYANGVRVHVRPVEGSGRVWVQALVFGPELTEAEGEKGITAAAVWAGRPGERGAAGAGALRAGVTPEGITARWNGENTELGDGLEKLRHWLESPRVDEERLAQLKERRGGGGGGGGGLVAGPATREGPGRPEGGNAGGAGGPSFERAAMGAIGEALGMTDGRGSRRGRPGAAAQGGPDLTAQRCEAWLTEKLGTLPLEVAIVGDVTLGGAEKLAREQFGSLPVRNGGEPAGPATLAEHRVLVRGEAPASVVKIVDATGTGAMLVVALPGPDMGDLAAVRRARLASRVLDAMIGPALDGAGVGHKQRAVLSMPGRVYTGAGALHVHVRIVGGEAEASKAAELIEGLIATLATGGAPEAIVQQAAEAAAKGAEQQEAGTEYWPGVLLMCGVYRLDPEQIADAPRAYRAMTAADVSEALRPCVGKGRRVIAVPQRAPSTEPVAPAGAGTEQPTPGASSEP